MGARIGKVSGIKWVRLVVLRDQSKGIGFLRTRLVYFSQDNASEGTISPVSIKESANILYDLAELELIESPDVESNSLAWKRWIKLILQALQ